METPGEGFHKAACLVSFSELGVRRGIQRIPKIRRYGIYIELEIGYNIDRKKREVQDYDNLKKGS